MIRSKRIPNLDKDTASQLANQSRSPNQTPLQLETPNQFWQFIMWCWYDDAGIYGKIRICFLMWAGELIWPIGPSRVKLWKRKGNHARPRKNWNFIKNKNKEMDYLKNLGSVQKRKGVIWKFGLRFLPYYTWWSSEIYYWIWWVSDSSNVFYLFQFCHLGTKLLTLVQSARLKILKQFFY